MATHSKQDTPRLEERFLTHIQGRDYVLYAGLLDLAHQQGLQSLRVKLLQRPGEANAMEAICRATAVTLDGKTFEDVGDANPLNTHRMIALHLIRMASTRAKARVLRDLTNIGITCLEELGEFESEEGGDTLTPKQEPGQSSSKQHTRPNASASDPEPAHRSSSATPAERNSASPEQQKRFERYCMPMIPAVNKKLQEAGSTVRFSPDQPQEFLQEMGQMVGPLDEQKIEALRIRPHQVIKRLVKRILNGSLPSPRPARVPPSQDPPRASGSTLQG